MFLPAALFILLSVASAEDAKRCYWCGPLGEQVHRSQRAPSCGPELEETVCDPGYTHCAVIATSPPYAESRLCVKFYQDECYSLYCNSSKTWRMICPCQGDLCNGQNTERETRAFATLAKIVGKNQRSKRLIGPKGFIPITPRKKVENYDNTITADNETTKSMSEEPTDEVVEAQTVMTDLLIEQESENDVGNDIGDTNKDSESEMQGDQPIEANEATTTEDNAGEMEINVQSETTRAIEDIKTNNDETTMAMMEENKNMQTVSTEFIKIEDITQIPTVMMIKPTTIEIELSVIHIKNPNDNLPPPEALQQNVTPAKATAPTTSGTLEMSTTTQIEITTQSMEEVTKKVEKTQDPMKNKNNNDSGDKEKAKKNGEEQTLVHLWELVVLMNILIYITL